ncbi:hypothetical protein ACFQ9X_06690 [Catenulispora yoronensis]
MTVSAQGVATVTLKAPVPGRPTDLNAVKDALVATFTDAAATPQLVGSTPLQTVEVSYPGCGGTCTASGSVNTAVTRSAPPVYWVCPSPGDTATVVSRVPGPSAGTASACGDGTKNVVDASRAVVTVPQKVAAKSPIAVRQPTSSSFKSPSAIVAVVVQNKDNTASVMVLDQRHPDQHKVWYNTSDPARVTDLEWDPVDGALWVVDSHVIYRLTDPGDQPPSSANADSLASPAGAPPTGFKPSPDGSRALLVTDEKATTSLWPAAIIAIDRTGASPRLLDAAVPLLTGQPGGLAHATDAAWADGRTVVLIGVSSTLNTPASSRSTPTAPRTP